jgi:HEAT repeat-containing protein 5
LNLVDAIASLVGKDSDFVFDALDGKFKHTNLGSEEKGEGVETNHENRDITKKNNINYRDEPVAFFFVLYGLAFEALVDQTINASQRLGILQALRRILRPVVSGNSVYQDTVFSETVDTLDRLVLTEGYNIQAVIIEIAKNMSLDHPSAKAGQDRSENLSEDIEQLFELTRNIILVLAGLLPNIGESPPHTRFNVNSDESLALIRLALSSLVDVASVFPSIIRHDLHACILHIFSTILATGVCQAEVVPQALPTFRRFIQEISFPNASVKDAAPTSLASSRAISLQLRGCLTRFLTTLTIAQRRESDTSLACAKSTLLALTILLTTSSHAIPPQDPVIPRVLNELVDCLQDVGLANVAAGCIRSILLTPAPRSPTDEVISRFLLPRLIAFLLGIPGRNGEIQTDPEHCRTAIAQALVSFTGSPAIPRNGIATALSIVVPALLTRAKSEGPAVYRETGGLLLELAKADQTMFRALVASMAVQQKAFVEEILRSTGIGGAVTGKGGGAGGTSNANDMQQSAPSITLRMDF